MIAPLQTGESLSGTAGQAKVTGRPPKYPFGGMAVGEAFDRPLSGVCTFNGHDISSKRLDDAARRHGLAYGKAFQVRTLRNEGVARCTRIA